MHEVILPNWWMTTKKSLPATSSKTKERTRNDEPHHAIEWYIRWRRCTSPKFRVFTPWVWKAMPWQRAAFCGKEVYSLERFLTWSSFTTATNSDRVALNLTTIFNFKLSRQQLKSRPPLQGEQLYPGTDFAVMSSAMFWKRMNSCCSPELNKWEIQVLRKIVLNSKWTRIFFRKLGNINVSNN